MKIVIRSSPEGDWKELVVNGQVFHEGHSIPEHVWVSLLWTYFRCSVEQFECDFE